MAEDLGSLSDQELLERLEAAYGRLPGTRGEERQLIWAEILELLEPEATRRSPRSTEPLSRPAPDNEVRNLVGAMRFVAAKEIISYHDEPEAYLAGARLLVETYGREGPQGQPT